MTDRSDDFRERLPEADRIRDRIREQREAGEGDTDSFQGVFPKTVDRGETADDLASKVSGPQPKSDGNDVGIEERNWTIENAWPSKVSDQPTEDGADAAFAKYDGVDGELKSDAPDPDGYYKYELKNLKDGGANPYLEIEEIPGESQQLADQEAPNWKLEQGMKVTEASNLVDDITASPDDTSLKWNNVDLKHGDVEDPEAGGIGDAMHRPDDAGIVDISLIPTQVKDEGVASDPVDSNAKLVLPQGVDEQVDPVGDALAPLDGGDDQLTVLPQLEQDAAMDAASPELAVDDADLGDGF